MADALPALVPVETPPFAYSLRSPTTLGPKKPPPRLRKITETKNQITDEREWLENNGLLFPADAATSPAHARVAPTDFGEPPAAVIRHSDHTVVLFGRLAAARLVVLDADNRVAAHLDFGAFRRAPRSVPSEHEFTEQGVFWAEAREGFLFVSVGHRTYAKSSFGQNAYLTAVDPRTGRILWQSQPLVANSRNFLLRDGYILSGYGFTAEPDFLYLIEAATGKVVERVPVRSGPEYILEKGDGRVYVRTYDTDYVFDWTYPDARKP